MVKILVDLGQGGHTTEMLRLLNLIGPKYEYAYLISRNDPISELHIKYSGDVYYAIMPMRKWHHQNKKYLPVWRFTVSILEQLIVMLRVRPEIIFSTGPGLAIPAAVWGRLFGAKIIHVETAARVVKLSRSGRIMYRLAHLFIVQWESLVEKYPDAIFAGRLL